MNDTRRTYTLDEIEDRTGFDKRTVAFYVQEGVLPRVGRRGPRTRYSQHFLDRLLFIRRVRDLQDQGRMGTMTLGDIREIFDNLSPEDISKIAAGEKPIEPVAHGAYQPSPHGPRPPERYRLDETHARIEGYSEIVREDGFEDESERAHAIHGEEEVEQLRAPLPPTDRLGRLLTQLRRSVEERGADRMRDSEQWTRAKVTQDITISARNLDENGVVNLEDVARILQRLMSDDDQSH